jgi:hypothetical protein
MRVVDDNISNQPRHSSTRGFTKRSSNGIPECPAPAQKKQLQEKNKLRRSHESKSALGRTQWEEYSGMSESREERHYEPKHNRRRTHQPIKESRARNYNSSFSTVDEKENIIQDTPEVALVAAQAYLLTMQPEPEDPRESMHLAAMKNLGLIED